MTIISQSFSMTARQRLRIGIVSATIACFGGLAAAEDEGWLTRNFIDPDDGALDASAWLSKGGVLPIPLIITEPAVKNGLGLALGYIGQVDRTDGAPPNFSGLAAIVTGNESTAYAAFHEGNYAEGRLKVTGFLAQGDINLDFYTGGSTSFAYNVNGVFGSAAARYQLGESNWFAGGVWRYQNAKVRLGGGPPSPDLPPALDTTLSGLGLVLDYETLDNTFTPTDGISARVSVIRFDQSIGSDFDYTKGGLSAFAYTSPTDKLTLGAKLMADTVNGNVPFYALPSINLRGIPAVRYQGDTAISSEVEATYQIAKRWRVVGFAGAGWADNQIAAADRTMKTAFGGGIRYRIARKLGIDMGLDVARGPEDTVVYIQFGRAWRRF